MNYLKIEVPDLNDSFSRVVLGGRQYMIRFTWNEAAGRWSFGIYSMQQEPIATGLRMVPRFPLTLQIVDEDFPRGTFGVFTQLHTIGRNDFVLGNAVFGFIPLEVDNDTV